MSRYDVDRPEMLRFVPEAARSVLEVGCDTGRFGAMLRQRVDALELIGVEPDPIAARDAEKVFDQVVCGTFPAVADSVRRRGGFDAIVFNDVLEHMSKPEEALNAAGALLSPIGVLVASIPNVRHISATGPLVVRGEWRYRDVGILDSTHLRFFTEKSIRRLFVESGWEIVTLEGINRCVRMGDQSLPRWVECLDWLTGGAISPFLFLQYGVVANRDASLGVSDGELR